MSSTDYENPPDWCDEHAVSRQECGCRAPCRRHGVPGGCIDCDSVDAEVIDLDGHRGGPPEDWTPIDLAAVLAAIEAGESTRPTADILRPDGATSGLFYLGRVNCIIGQSGSGKTWIAVLAAREVILGGGHVVYVDLEDRAELQVRRLLQLGVSAGQILTGLTYVEQPETPLTAQVARLMTSSHLVVIDSWNALLALAGRSQDSGDDVTVNAGLLKRLAASGPAVLLLDHVPKNAADPMFGIGSQAKKSILSGAMYRLGEDHALHETAGGLLRLTVIKDRAGGLPWPKGTVAAMLHQRGTSHSLGWSMRLVDGAGHHG